MNWFERYGIVGAYFLIFTFFWLNLLSDFKIDITTPLIAQFAALFLPLGYLIAVFSQWIYYLHSDKLRRFLLHGEQIHREFVAANKEELEGKIKTDDDPDEAICESRLTSWVRFKNPILNDTKTIKYLGSFNTRRWDVLAINRSIILSTYLSPLAVFLLISFCQSINFKLKSIIISNLLGMILLSACICIVLCQSCKILGKQIYIVLKELTGCDKRGVMEKGKEERFREEIYLFHQVSLIIFILLGISCLWLIIQQPSVSLVVFLLFIPPLPLLFGKMVIVVNDKELTVTFGYIKLIRKRIPLSEITSAEVVTYRPILNFGGWIIRCGRFKGIRTGCLFLRGNKGVLLSLDRQIRACLLKTNKLIIGSQRPEKLLKSVK